MHLRLRDEEREEEGEGKSNFRSKDKKRGEEKRKEKETRKRNTFPFFAGLRAPRSRRLAFDECLIRNSKLGYSGFRRRIHGYKYVSRVVARPGILLSRRTCSISFPSFLFFSFSFFLGRGEEGIAFWYSNVIEDLFDARKEICIGNYIYLFDLKFLERKSMRRVA